MDSQGTDYRLEMLLGDAREIASVQGRSHTLLSLGFGRSPEGRRHAIAIIAILLGVSLMAAVTFVAGTGALFSEAPAPWTHGLLALIVAQSAIMAGAGLKLFNAIESSQQSLQKAARSATRLKAQTLPVSTDPVTALPFQSGLEMRTRRGRIGDRDFVQYADGSLEIDTRLGRRRFGSLEAAEEFLLGRASGATERAAA
jgi:hypothetical protein